MACPFLFVLVLALGAYVVEMKSNRGAHATRVTSREAEQEQAAGSGPPALPAPPRTDPRVRVSVGEVDRLAAELDGGTLAVAVLDRASGELVGGAQAATPMYTASVVKLFVAVDVVLRGRGGMPVSDEDVSLIRRALGPSDDNAMNTLWDRFDGSGAVTRVAAEFGLVDTRPPELPGDWGDTVSSARDVATVLGRVAALPPPQRELVLSSLDAAPRIATGGFDQGFGLESSPRPVAVKAGWMCCHDGRLSLHSTGLIGPDRRYAVALLSTQPTSLGYSGARAKLDAAAAPLLAHLG